jgi:type IV pilus assembly protein PilA
MKNKGFTLIELMIVVAIIAIIAAIAIPNLLRSRLQSNESAAIGNLRTVVGSQTAFAAAERGYADDLNNLMTPAAGPAYLDIDLTPATGVQGYVYALVAAPGAAAVVSASGVAAFEDFNCTAVPSNQDVSGIRGFFVDASGVIRFTPDGSAPTVASDPI